MIQLHVFMNKLLVAVAFCWRGAGSGNAMPDCTGKVTLQIVDNEETAVASARVATHFSPHDAEVPQTP